MIPVDLVSFYVPMATGTCEKAFNRIADVAATRYYLRQAAKVSCGQRTDGEWLPAFHDLNRGYREIKIIQFSVELLLCTISD